MKKEPTYDELKQRISQLEEEVTSLRRREEALLQSEAYFKALMEQNPISIQVYDRQGNLLAVNQAWQDMFQLKPEDFVHSYNCLHDEQAVKLGSAIAFEKVLTGQTVFLKDFEYDPIASGFHEGRKRWMRSYFFPLKDHTGLIKNIVLMHEDITQRVKTEEKYKLLIEHSSESIFIIQNNYIPFHNQQLIELTGYGPEEISQRKFYEYVHPKDRERIIETHLKRLRGEYVPSIIQFRIITKNGATKWLQTNAVIIEWDDAPAALVFASDITDLKAAEEMVRDHQAHLEKMVADRTREIVLTNKKLSKEIEERKKIEAALLEEKNKIEAVLAAIGDGLTVQDRDFRILYQNELHKTRQGDHKGELCYNAYQGKNEICDNCVLAKCFEDGRVHKRETSAETENGTMYMEVSASPVKDAAGNIVAGVEVVRDITENKKLADQLMQSQKMEAIGTLAGGIAHDFNNILTGIMGYADLLMINGIQSSSKTESLNEIIMASKRAADLIKQILTFSRFTGQEYHPLYLQVVIKEISKLIRGSLPSNIDIRLDIDPMCGTISGNATQLHQLILNLCTNALHAMQTDGGILDICLAEIEVSDDDVLHTEHAIPPGKYAKLVIADTGHGIPDDIKHRVFDPYFTSKPKGEGTGLGLSTVHGIVKSHKGHILLHSKPDEGSRFEIFFNLLGVPTDVSPSEHKKEIPTAAGHVLVVDDEEMVMNIARKILERIGCTVTSTTSSLEALKMFQNTADSFDAVLTDQTMPNLSGYELAKKILTIRPDMPIILATGHSETVNREKALEAGIREFIMKPFDIHTLSHAVANLLPRPIDE